MESRFWPLTNRVLQIDNGLDGLECLGIIWNPLRGQSCSTVCGGLDLCDLETTKTLTSAQMTSMGANCSKTKTRETIIAAPSWKPKNNVCLLSHTNVTCDAAKGGLVRFCYCADAPAPAPRRALPGDWKKGELGEWVEDVGMLER